MGPESMGPMTAARPWDVNRLATVTACAGSAASSSATNLIGRPASLPVSLTSPAANRAPFRPVVPKYASAVVSGPDHPILIGPEPSSAELPHPAASPAAATVTTAALT